MATHLYASVEAKGEREELLTHPAKLTKLKTKREFRKFSLEAFPEAGGAAEDANAVDQPDFSLEILHKL